MTLGADSCITIRVGKATVWKPTESRQEEDRFANWTVKVQTDQSTVEVEIAGENWAVQKKELLNKSPIVHNEVKDEIWSGTSLWEEMLNWLYFESVEEAEPRWKQCCGSMEDKLNDILYCTICAAQ